MMRERRLYKRVVKNGIFAVIGDTPYKIIDIGLGGVSFCFTTDSCLIEEQGDMEILVMNGSIHYIQHIKHSYVTSSSLDINSCVDRAAFRVCVAFKKLSQHQLAQFKMLLGVS